MDVWLRPGHDNAITIGHAVCQLDLVVGTNLANPKGRSAHVEGPDVEEQDVGAVETWT